MAGDIDVTDIAWGHLDVSDKDYQNIFRYLTVTNFAPFSDGEDNDGDGDSDEASELAVAGRININTAPWFVIAQLPWIQDPTLQNDSVDKFKLAHAITAYRDRVDLSGELFVGGTNWGGPDFSTRTGGPGFTHVGDLLNVTGTGDRYDMHYYKNVGGNLVLPPEYTLDSAVDDLEERDIIFHRVSNLVTVRSDVFTAYILVRVGERGPQRRMIAIFDRSNVYSASDRPKLVALHPVADPG